MTPTGGTHREGAGDFPTSSAAGRPPPPPPAGADPARTPPPPPPVGADPARIPPSPPPAGADPARTRPPSAPAPAARRPPPPPPPADPGPEEQSDRKRKRPLWRELPVLIVIAFAVALLIKTFFVQAFFIPSASMEPTLVEGDRVLVEKVTGWFGGPGRGDVVVFERRLPGLTGSDEVEDESIFSDIRDAFRELFGFPTGTSRDFIKRVIGVGGDTVEGRDGKVFVNDQPIDEPYLPEGTETAPFPPIDVPEGAIFVMGDNRANSDDSRNFGPIPEDSVIGNAFVLVWPPSDFAGL